MNKSPSDGDRISLGGKYPQFLIFAEKIYQRLNDRSLKWIKVADPEAGILDDIQIAYNDTIEAIQVKWSNKSNPKPFSYNDLVVADSLLKEIIEARLSLKQKNPSFEVKGILLTNRPCSSHDSIHKSKKSLNSFYEKVWKPFKDSQDEFKPIPKWKQVWEEFLSDISVNANELNQLKDIELIFNYKQTDTFRTNEFLESQIKEDIEKIFNFLIKTVADREKLVHLSKEELLQKLGWSEDFQQISDHNFYSKEPFHHEPIKETIDELNKVIESKDGGYVILLGSPGAGKSTMLTHWMRDLRGNIFKYFAYVPNSVTPNEIRGESQNFLHDLIIQFYKKYIGQPDHRLRQNRSLLILAFNNALKELGELYKTRNERSFIVIDGLDHISRDYSPERSLIKDLPSPESIPEGVYIILGSRTQQLKDFSPSIKLNLNDEDRRVNMTSLPKESVNRIINKYLGGEFTRFQNEIYNLSDGHPLYLTYLLEKISKIEESKIETILTEELPYSGDIFEIYEKIWVGEGISENSNLCSLLGLICRIRISINLNIIENEWDEEYSQSLVDLIRFADHFFNKIDNNNWAFFHSSFKEFLINKTSLSIVTKEFNKSRDKNFHSILADLFWQSETRYKWEIVYHLFKAERFRELTTKINADFFRNQYFNFRPVSQIFSDIKLGVKAACKLKDLPLLSKFLLVYTEIYQRLVNFDNDDWLPFMLKAGFEKEVLKTIYHYNKLQVPNSLALETAILLYEEGVVDPDIKRIVYLANLIDTKNYEVREDDSRHYRGDRDSSENLIKLWGVTGLLYKIHTIEHIQEVLDKIEIEPHYINKPTLVKASSTNCEFKIIEKTVDAWEKNGEYNKCLKLIEQATKSVNVDKFKLFFILRNWKELTISKESLITYILDSVEQLGEYLDDSERLCIGYRFFSINPGNNDLSIIIKDIDLPHLEERFASAAKYYIIEIALSDRFRYTFLKSIIKDKIEAYISNIPEPTNNQFNVFHKIERNIELLGLTAAQAKRKTKTYNELRPLLINLLNFFKLNHFEISRLQRLRRRLYGARERYYSLIISTLWKINPHYIDSFAKDIFEIWDEQDSIQDDPQWDSHEKRIILVALLENGYSPFEILRKAKVISSSIFQEGDMYSRIEEAKSWVELYQQLNSQKDAQDIFKKLLVESFAVRERKDSQNNTWFEFFKKVNFEESERLAFIKEVSTNIPYIDDICQEGKWVANDLLEISFNAHPNQAFSLLKKYLEKGLCEFVPAINRLIVLCLNKSNRHFDVLYSLFIQLINPLSENSCAYEVREFMSKFIEINGKNNLVSFVKKLISDLEIYATAKHLESCKREIFDFLLNKGINPQSVGLDEAKLLNDGYYNTGLTNYLHKDGIKYSLHEAYEKSKSFEGLIYLLQNESEKSKFEWNNLIWNRTYLVNKDNFNAFSSAIYKSRVYTKDILLCKIAKGIDNIGFIQERSKTLLDSSKQGSWVHHFDGASRVQAIRVSKYLNEKNGIDKAFYLLESDANNTNLYELTKEYFSELIVLLSESNKIPYLEIYPYLKEYLFGLYQNDSPIELTISLADSPPDIDTFIADLLFYLAYHPTNFISSTISEIIAKDIANGNQSELTKLLKKKLADGDNIISEKALVILDSASLLNNAVIHHFVDELKVQVESMNWENRKRASFLLKRIDIKHTPVLNMKVQLPLVYTLEMNEPINFEKDTKYERGFVKNTSNALELIRFVDLQATILSKKFSLNKYNIACAIENKLKAIRKHEYLWQSEYAKSIRANLDEVKLGLSFPRPRYTYVKDSLLNCVTELSLITNDQYSFLEESYFRFNDPSLICIPSMPKPKFIKALREPGNDNFNSKFKVQWVYEINDNIPLEDFSHETKSKDGKVILAFHTIQKYLFHSQFVEEKSMVIAPNIDIPHSKNSIFFNVNNQYYKEYPNLKNLDINLPSIVIKNSSYFFYLSIKNEWLALNPILANQLEWTYKEPFQWIDKNGNIMVESIFWQKGSLHTQSSIQDEVGEGWVVYASKEAFLQIQTFFGNFLVKEGTIVRGSQNDGQPIENINGFIVPL